MAEFAKLNENNIVIQVVVIDDLDIIDPDTNMICEDLGKKICEDLYDGGIWLLTSSAESTDGFRKNSAGIDYSYDSQLDAFLRPKPYDSWILDLETFDWKPPIDYPELYLSLGTNIRYQWNEESQSWDTTNILENT